MHFTHRSVDSLPALAWAAFIGSGQVHLIHGWYVDVTDDGWFEGAWPGRFDAWNFHTTHTVFGSGAYLDAHSITIVNPSHTLESVYFSTHKGLIACSNSLSLLLYLTQNEPDKFHLLYSRQFTAIVQGITYCFRTIRFSSRPVHLLCYRNLRILENGEYRIVDKPPPPLPRDFESYKEILLETCRQTVLNASAAARRFRYEPLTTTSSGYDSPACTVLARAAGCTRAITFSNSQKHENDSGLCIGQALGLQVVEKQRPDTADFDPNFAALFLANGTLGEDILYGAFADELRGSLLFTGFHGDKIWDRQINPTSVIKRGDISGASLGEFRLWTNFIHLPVPFVSAVHHPAVHTITKSAEMAPYSIGTKYDRPIPRRLVEETGIPRDWFGTSKKAVSVLLYHYRTSIPTAIHAEADQLRNTLRLKPLVNVNYGVQRRWFDHLIKRRPALFATFRTLLTKTKAVHPAPIFDYSHPFNSMIFTAASLRVITQYQDMVGTLQEAVELLKVML